MKAGRRIAEFRIIASPQVDNPVITEPPKINIGITNSSFISYVAAGNFTLKALNSNLPFIAAVVGQTSISFTGCNSISIPCQSVGGSTFKINGAITSTRKFCTVDNDQKYIQVLKEADGFGHDGNNFFLTSKGKRII